MARAISFSLLDVESSVVLHASSLLRRVFAQEIGIEL